MLDQEQAHQGVVEELQEEVDQVVLLGLLAAEDHPELAPGEPKAQAP